MLAEKDRFHEAETLSIVEKDKSMNVLYEVSSIPEDISEANAIKAATDGEV